MATLHVRNVPEHLYELLRRRAEVNGRSIGAETVQILSGRLEPMLRRRRRQLTGVNRLGEARPVIEAAQDEARALGHGAIGTEHLLLALLRPEIGGAATGALESLGLVRAGARDEILRRVGRGESVVDGRLPFTPLAKKALDLAMREAIAAGEEGTHPEGVALGLIRAGEGLGFELIRGAEPDLDRALRCLCRARDEDRERTPAGDVPFRVLDLEGRAADWEAQLNDAAAESYELLAIVDRRAVLRRSAS